MNNLKELKHQLMLANLINFQVDLDRVDFAEALNTSALMRKQNKDYSEIMNSQIKMESERLQKLVQDYTLSVDMILNADTLKELKEVAKKLGFKISPVKAKRPNETKVMQEVFEVPKNSNYVYSIGRN